jgi:RNA polymerase sigma-70 factor (ECF subfamily)
MDGLALTPTLQRFSPRRRATRRPLFAVGRRPWHEGVVKIMTGALPTSELKSTAQAAAADLADLIERVAAAADREAFASLFTHFAPRLKSYLLGLGARPAAAEELVQDTLLTVWRKAASFDRARAGAATWIFTIARNLRIDAVRRERTALAYTIDLTEEPDAPETPDEELSISEREGRVREAMKGLSDDQATVVKLAFFQEKPHSEIAEVLGIPLGTVKSRVRLAMSRLRERLEDLS